jgi:hypothetical protein
MQVYNKIYIYKGIYEFLKGKQKENKGKTRIACAHANQKRREELNIPK